MSAEPDGWLYFKRALSLRCPECGESHVFAPLHDTHSLKEWMQPLDGCPKCHYKYLREPGYFLLSTWALNYGVVGGLGLAAAFLPMPSGIGIRRNGKRSSAWRSR